MCHRNLQLQIPDHTNNRDIKWKVPYALPVSSHTVLEKAKMCPFWKWILTQSIFFPKITVVEGWIVSSQNSTPQRTSACDLIWKWSLCRCNWLRWGRTGSGRVLNSMTGIFIREKRERFKHTDTYNTWKKVIQRLSGKYPVTQYKN